MSGPSWILHARCGDLPAEEADRIFFPERGGSAKRAQEMCSACPVFAACLEYAVRSSCVSRLELAGIWAGTTVKDRRMLRRLRKENAA